MVGVGPSCVVVALGEEPLHLREPVAMAVGRGNGLECIRPVAAVVREEHRELAPCHGESGVELDRFAEQGDPALDVALLVREEGPLDVLPQSR